MFFLISATPRSVIVQFVRFLVNTRRRFGSKSSVTLQKVRPLTPPLFAIDAHDIHAATIVQVIRLEVHRDQVQGSRVLWLTVRQHFVLIFSPIL